MTEYDRIDKAIKLTRSQLFSDKNKKTNRDYYKIKRSWNEQARKENSKVRSNIKSKANYIASTSFKDLIGKHIQVQETPRPRNL